jgi:glycosyltransferase 2 family protein
VELGAVPIFSTFVAAPILGVAVLAWRAITYHMNLLIGGIISLKVVKDMDRIKKLMGSFTELQLLP